MRSNINISSVYCLHINYFGVLTIKIIPGSRQSVEQTGWVEQKLSKIGDAEMSFYGRYFSR